MGSGDLGAEAGRKRLAELVRSTGAFKHSEEGFKLASGKTSKHYFDLRLLSGDPEGLHVAAGVLYNRIKKVPGAKSVGGLESGSIPLAAAVSQLSRIEHERDPANPTFTSFYVRKAAKEHGTRKMIEGKVLSPVVIIDDVITSGMSAVRAIDAVKEEGHKCARVMCIIFRGDREDHARIHQKTTLQSVFREADFTEDGKPTPGSSPRLLVDAMYGGLAEKLRKLRYEAEDVKELEARGIRARNDYSIFMRAKEEKMVLVSRDGDLCDGCVAEGVPCVNPGENPTAEDVVAALNDPAGICCKKL